jgi:pimeloyl-ACP methyl ester carboxylesterase
MRPESLTDELPVCIFLPGIIAPAIVRYAALVRELGASARAYTKELELYTLSPPPTNYAIGDEVEGLLRRADRAGLERFHLYGHSGGGAVALAFTAEHPGRVLSLTLDEAAFDFSEEMRADLAEYRELQRLMLDEPAAAMPRFMQLELKPGVEFTPPASGAPPLPNRPAGIASLLRAFEQHRIDTDALRRFDRPVLYTRGSLSADRYERSTQRLAQTFPNYREGRLRGPPPPEHLQPGRARTRRHPPPRPLGRGFDERRPPLYVTITASKGLSSEQAARVHSFLDEFLPRLKQQPGVQEILHGATPDGSEVTTVIVWESADDAKRYRESKLIREPMALEAELGLTSMRDGFTVTQHLS